MTSHRPLPSRPVAAVYGPPGALGTLAGRQWLSGAQPLEVVEVTGMLTLPGWAISFLAVDHHGYVIAGALPYTNNAVNGTGRLAAMYRLDPVRREWLVIPVLTDLGVDAENPTTGVGGEDYADLSLVEVAAGDRRIVAISGIDYRQWPIADASPAYPTSPGLGRYPALTTLNAESSAVDYARSPTAQTLQASSPDGPDAFPDTLSGTGETYAGIKAQSECDVWDGPGQSGHLFVVDYAVTTGGKSGRAKVFDPTTMDLIGYLELPNYLDVDGTAVRFSPRGPACSRRSFAGIEYVSIIGDCYLDSNPALTVPFCVIEFTWDPATLTLALASSPWVPKWGDVLDGDTFAADYDLRANQVTYDADGNCWVGCGRATNNTGAFAVFNPHPIMGYLVEADGDHAYTSVSPPGGAFGEQVPADVIVAGYPAFGTSQRPSWLITDWLTGGVAAFGFAGQVAAFVPDRPLVPRADVLANGSFAANVTGWTPVLATGSFTWDSGGGGRALLRRASAGTGDAAVQSEEHACLPGDAVAAWFEVDCVADRRAFFGYFSFIDADGVGLGAYPGPSHQGIVGTTVRVHVAARAPANAVAWRLVVQGVGLTEFAVTGEQHHVTTVYAAPVPARMTPLLDLNLAALFADQDGTRNTFPGDIDRARRRAFLAVQQVQNANTCPGFNPADPSTICFDQQLPQYVIAVDLGLLFGEPFGPVRADLS